MVALKKDQRPSHGWSKPKILKILSRLHRTKVGLAYAKVRREFPALVSAAEAYFGSWGKALYADGIDPNLYFVHHKWRKTGTADKGYRITELSPTEAIKVLGDGKNSNRSEGAFSSILALTFEFSGC